jgi:hypothetical protein
MSTGFHEQQNFIFWRVPGGESMFIFAYRNLKDFEAKTQ